MHGNTRVQLSDVGRLLTTNTQTTGKTTTKDLDVSGEAVMNNITSENITVNNATLETFAARSATVEDMHADSAMFTRAESVDMKVHNNLVVNGETSTKTAVFTDESDTIPPSLRTIAASNVKRLYNQFNVKNKITTKLTYSTGKARATLFDASSYEMITKQNGERPVIFYEKNSSCTLVNIDGKLYALMAYHTFLIDDVNSKIPFESAPGVFKNSILNPLYNLYANWFGIYSTFDAHQRLILERLRVLANNSNIPVVSSHDDSYTDKERTDPYSDFTDYNTFFNVPGKVLFGIFQTGAWEHIAERDLNGKKVVDINILDKIDDVYRDSFNKQNVQLTLNKGDKLVRIELHHLFNENTYNLFLPDSDLAALHITENHFENSDDYDFFIQNALKIDSDNLEDHNPTIEDINSLAINNNIAISAFTDDGFALTNPLNVVLQGEGRSSEIMNEYSDNYLGTGYNRGIQVLSVNKTLGKESSGSPCVYFNDNTLETILLGIKTHETDTIGTYSSIFYILNGFKLVEFDHKFQRNRHVLHHYIVDKNDRRSDFLYWFAYTYKTNAAQETIDEFLNNTYNITNNNNKNYDLHQKYPEGLSTSIGAPTIYEIGDNIIEEIAGTKITRNKIWHPDTVFTTDVTPEYNVPGQYQVNAMINGNPGKLYLQNWHRITGPHPLSVHIVYSVYRRGSAHIVNDRTTSNYEKMVNRKKLKDIESKFKNKIRK